MTFHVINQQNVNINICNRLSLVGLAPCINHLLSVSWSSFAFLKLISNDSWFFELDKTKTRYTSTQRSWRGGGGCILDSPCPSVRLSVRPSVCWRHGFRGISQVCFGISILNSMFMLVVVIGGSLLIFSDVIFKMAAWQPYWIFWFPDSNFSLALNINSKPQRHNTYVHG